MIASQQPQVTLAGPTRRRPKVVLYNPQSVFYTMPLGILAVGSQLDPDRYEVVLIDGRLVKDAAAAIGPHLPDAICLGVSVLTGAPIQDALEVSRAAKRMRPDLPIVWGGWHPSMFPRECLDEPSVDITVQGQGEATLVELVERLERGESLAGCCGCAFRVGGEPTVNPPRQLQPFESLRPPNYELLDVPRYFALKGKRQLDYIASHGCHFRCAFCADPFVFQRQWTGLSPGRIGAELASLWERYRFEDVNFQDETFFTHAPRAAAIAAELLQRRLPITWAATMRADQGVRLSEKAFADCKRSGLRRVLIGVESGDPEILRRIRKDIRLEQVFEAAQRCLQHDVAARFPFIVGFPEESTASVRATLAVAKHLASLSPRFDTPIFYFRPYPGTALTEQAVRDGYDYPRTLEEWSRFDYVGEIGPWVTPEKYRLIERFKFFQEQARSGAGQWRRPLQALARWRLAHDRYEWPVEMAVSRWLRPPVRLS